uniref:Uncharacterized protein n=1 Tax=Prolemur simus TaxID=1328070 RepID=A0A8C9AHZ7_PROSS
VSPRCPLLLALALAAVPCALGVCPAPADLEKEDGTRTCAKLYDKSDPYCDNCCAGAELSLQPGAHLPYLPSSWADTASSLVVAPRRELTVWSLRGKSGRTRKFSSGAHPRREGHRSNAISALHCRCPPVPRAQPTSLRPRPPDPPPLSSLEAALETPSSDPANKPGPPPPHPQGPAPPRLQPLPLRPLSRGSGLPSLGR